MKLSIDNCNFNFPIRIVEFYPEDQTADIIICAEKVTKDSTENQKSNKRGMIERVPVHILRGGQYAFTQPIEAGDTGTVYFSQVGYDHWLYEDKDEAGLLSGLPKPWLKRKFSEDDGFCTVGFGTIPRTIQNYSSTDSEWRNTDVSQVIRLKPNGDIELITTSKVYVKAPEVVAECTNATVTASTKVAVTTPLVDITAAMLKLSGSAEIGESLEVKKDILTPLMVASTSLTTPVLNATGTGSMAAGKMTLTADIETTKTIKALTVEGTDDVIAAGVSGKSHTHNVTALGAPTSIPT